MGIYDGNWRPPWEYMAEDIVKFWRWIRKPGNGGKFFWSLVLLLLIGVAPVALFFAINRRFGWGMLLLYGAGAVYLLFDHYIWDPLSKRSPGTAKSLKKAAIIAAVVAVCVYGAKSCENVAEGRRQEHDRELWEEAYNQGQNDVIEDPDQYIDMFFACEDAIAEAYNEGYTDGWNACNNGVPLE